MTTTKDIKQQQVSRMVELGRLARQRYLDGNGDLRLSVGSLNNNDTLTDEERKEFRDLFNQVVIDEEIAAYFKKHGSWRDRIASIRTYAKKPGFYEKSLVSQLDIYEETRFLTSTCVSPVL